MAPSFAAGRRIVAQLVRLEARTIGLRGSRRLLELLAPPATGRADRIRAVLPYDGGLMQIDTSSFIEWWIYSFGSFEGGAIQLLKRLVRQGDVVIDVGANVGVFTIPLARAVGSTGAVHAFEPSPNVMARLVENLALNNLRNVTTCAAAVGSSIGQATLYAPRHANQGQASLRPKPGNDDAITCAVTTVDEYVKTHAVSKVDLIKIDVEGAELSALHGCAETLLRWSPCLYVEVSPDYLRRFGHSARELGEYLRGVGYELWRNETVEQPRLGRGIRLTRVNNEAYPSEGLDQYWLAVRPGAIPRPE